MSALLTAREANPGDLTSALPLILCLLLIFEYNFGRVPSRVAIPVILVAFGAALTSGLNPNSKAFLTRALVEASGITFFILLYGAVALRHRIRYREEAQRLEAMVKERTAELEGLLSERTAMLNEIHHRVKNNLQIVASLLRLEAGRGREATAQVSLEAGLRRIEAMALVHEYLYKMERLDLVDLENYAKRLLGAITEESGFPFDIRVEGRVQCSLDFAMPFGLLLHELATNAQRHAFPDGGGGAVIGLAAREGRLRLEVSDEGVGIVEGGKKTGTFGLELVGALAEQLHGSMERGAGKGTRWVLEFPLEPGAKGFDPGL